MTAAAWKTRRWTRREDELLLVRAMALDEAADFLGRTPAELWARAGELDVDLEPPREPEPVVRSREPELHKSNGHAAAAPQSALPAPHLDVSLDSLEVADCEISRGMPRPAAEMAGRRVALALLRGSEEVALAAVRDAWADHWGEHGPLPQGAELLEIPLARVIREVRTLNRLEREGILTVGQFLEQGPSLVEHEGVWQIGSQARAALRGQLLELRTRAGLDGQESGRLTAAPEACASPQASNGRAGRPPKRKPTTDHRRPTPERPAVADDSPDMRAFCEAETVRLLPLIERIAWSLKVPIPIEDLVQEGAKAAFVAIPRFDPNHEGGKLKIETFLVPRIRGGMLDYVRKTGRLTTGGPRSRYEHVESLSRPAPFEDDGGRRPELLAALADDSAAEAIVSAAARDVWHGVLKGFDQRERLLVLEYFVHGRTLKSISGDLDVSESRCSQMLSQILRRLRSIDEETGGRVREALT